LQADSSPPIERGQGMPAAAQPRGKSWPPAPSPVRFAHEPCW
jgi:hypothetical protein